MKFNVHEHYVEINHVMGQFDGEWIWFCSTIMWRHPM
jgi:hypothetical protein